MDGQPLDFAGDVYTVLPEPEPLAYYLELTPEASANLMVEKVTPKFQYWFFKCHTHDDVHGDAVFGYWVPYEKKDTSHHYLFTKLTETYWRYTDLQR
jgi:hypothetical protein